jgi:type IV secretion system protein VirB5
MSLRDRLALGRRDLPAPPTRLDAEAATQPSTNHIIAARNEFSGVFGDLAKGKRNWQLMAFSLTVLLALVTFSYVRLVASARVVPYLIQVDRLGQVLEMGPADRTATPDQRLVAAQLAQFVRAIRTVLPAAAAAGQAEMMKRGYAFLAPEAAGSLNDYFADQRNDPRSLGSRLTRQVDVTAILRVPNSEVWRLQWTETERPTQPGGATRTTAWEAYATVKLVPPVTEQAVQDNPLGLYITTINWAQVGERTWDSSEIPNDSIMFKRSLSHDSGVSR